MFEITNKYYYNPNYKININSAINEYFEEKNEGKFNLNFIYLFNEEDLLNENIENEILKVKEFLIKNNIESKKIIISFRHQLKEKLNNNETVKILYNLTQKYPQINLGLENENITWSVNEIIDSNIKIDNIVNEINSKNLSDVEKLLYAYLIVTENKYKDVNKNYTYLARSVYGVLNSDEICCVGYCELFKEIVKRLNINVKLFSNNVWTLIINEHFGLHRNLICYIKDDKYNIDGFYYLDPTWDAKIDEHDKDRLNFFLIYLNEIKNINEYEIVKNKIEYSGYKLLPRLEGSVTSINRLENSDKVSFYNNGAEINEEFSKFILKDKKFSYIFKNKTDDEKINLLEKNFNVILEEIKNNTTYIKKETFFKILTRVIEQKENLTSEKLYKRVKNIIEYNKIFNKMAFQTKAKTIFNETIQELIK